MEVFIACGCGGGPPPFSRGGGRLLTCARGGGRIRWRRELGGLGAWIGGGVEKRSWAGEPVSFWTTSLKSFLLMLYTGG